MTVKFSDAFRKRCKRLFLLSIGFSIIICKSAHAVLINFDELDQDSYVDANGDLTVLSNEYESQGLLFRSSAYLVEWSGSIPVVSAPNYVAGPGFGFEFIGEELPVYVSFYLGSHSQTAVSIDVRGPYYSKQVTSSGEIHGMTGNHGTPYIPNQVFSFRSRTGISSVSFSGQGDNYIDDLTYTYATSVSVPEPPAFILLAIGFLSLIGSRLKFLCSYK